VTIETCGEPPPARAATAAWRASGLLQRQLPWLDHDARRAHPAGLTSRELEIVAFLAQGLSNPEIAKRSYVSVKTVDNQVSSILSKLGVRRRVDVAREAMRLGLMPDPAAVGKTE